MPDHCSFGHALYLANERFREDADEAVYVCPGNAALCHMPVLRADARQGPPVSIDELEAVLAFPVAGAG